MIIWKLTIHTCHYYGKTHKLINYVKTEKNLLAIFYVRVQGAIDTLISTLLTLVWGNLIIEENISNSGNRQVSFKTINPLHAKRYYVNCTLLRRRNEFFFVRKKVWTRFENWEADDAFVSIEWSSRLMLIRNLRKDFFFSTNSWNRI